MRLSQAQWLVLTLTTLSLGLLLPAAFNVGFDLANDRNQWLVFAVMIWSTLRLGLILAEARDSIVGLFFWSYVYIFLGLAPQIQLSQRKFAFPGTYSNVEVESAVLIVLLGLLAYEFGNVVAKRRYSSGQHSKGVLNRSLQPRSIFRLGLISLVLVPILTQRIGGVHVLWQSRQSLGAALGAQTTFDYGNNASAAISVAFMTVPVHTAAIGCLLLRRTMDTESWRRAFPKLWLASVIGIDLVVNNPISQSRFWFGTVLVSFICVFIDTSRAEVFRIFGAGVLVALIFVFPYADRFRYDNENPTSKYGITEVFTDKPDHDSFQQILNGVQYVHAEGTTDVRQLVGVLTFWVPRSVWQDKPLDTGPLLARYEGYRLENVSAPLWVEGYINASWPGTFAFLFIFGLLSFRLEADWRVRSASRGVLRVASALVPFFAAYQLILLRGPLLQATGRVVLLLLVARLCSRSPRRSSAFIQG